MEKTILVVEDEPLTNKLISEQLRSSEFKVLQAFDGKSAVDIYSSDYKNINMILLDMKLPDIDGSKCIDHFRQINKDARIVICSGIKYESNDYHVESIIHKPFTYDELEEICNKYA